MIRQRLLHLIVALNMFGLGFAGGASAADESVLSAPKDTTPYARLAVAEDYTEAYVESEGNLARFLIVDTVVSNTDPTLNTTDTFNDGEPSIAVNPQNRNEIVITTFSGSSGTNAALWHSLDEGVTWTKRFTIPSAPGIAGFLGCTGPSVCDQTVDYGRGNQMSGAFLDSAPDVHSGTTTNPASAALAIPRWIPRCMAGSSSSTHQSMQHERDHPNHAAGLAMPWSVSLVAGWRTRSPAASRSAGGEAGTDGAWLAPCDQGD
jgi:hypothetical protein